MTSVGVRDPSATIPQVDVTSSNFKDEAYSFYERLREHAPVHVAKLPNAQRAWLVSRYDDVARVLKDDRFAKDKNNAVGRAPTQLPRVFGLFRTIRPLEHNMLDVDAPDHTRLRNLVHMAFTPRRVAEMRERIERLCDELLRESRLAGTMDVIRDYALPIPLTIISEMMGIPVEDQMRFHRWSNATVSASASSNAGMVAAIPAIWRLASYLRKIIRHKRLEPQDDLISALVEAEESGDRLDEDELLAMVFLLVVAGHETTVNLIGNAVLALIRNPGQFERLRGEPSLYRTAVEEFLRFHSPIEVATERYAREDVEVAGVVIPKGEFVCGVLASANRDEAQFDRPAELDLAREPNRHLAFGLGVHFCLGAPLARLEGQIAIRSLVEQTPGLGLAVPEESLRWRKGLNLRGLETLPVSF